MGFMTNPEEDRKMASPDFQNVMVKGIVNGIDKYFRERQKKKNLNFIRQKN